MSEINNMINVEKEREGYLRRQLVNNKRRRETKHFKDRTFDIIRNGIAIVSGVSQTDINL